jgi:hypothetical protein
MTRLVENQELEDQVGLNETEAIQGGCEVNQCYVYECSDAYSDEDNSDNVVF